jgi:hypothetical protein
VIKIGIRVPNILPIFTSIVSTVSTAKTTAGKLAKTRPIEINFFIIFSNNSAQGGSASGGN